MVADSEKTEMSHEMECPDCFGTGQKVEMRPLNFGRSLPPYQVCPRCEGTEKVPYPKPVRYARRKSMGRIPE